METEALQKAKTGTAGKPPPPPPKPVQQADDQWRSMETAPKDGSYLFLKGDPCADKDMENHWYWYTTRKYQNHRWMETGWWRRRFGPNAPPSFTPGGWRAIKEGLPKS